MDSQEMIEDDEISLIDLFAVLLRYKFLIIAITGIAMIGVLVFSVVSIMQPPEKSILPNEYTPSAAILISNNSGTDVSSLLSSSGLGSLASLAGVSVPTTQSNSALAGYIISSNYVLDKVIEKFNLVERYQIKDNPVGNTRKVLKENLKSNNDDETGIFTVSFTDIDPVFAKEVVNYAVEILEERFTSLNVDQDKITQKNLEENIKNSYATIIELQDKITELENSVSYPTPTYNMPSIVRDTTMIKMELSAQQEIYKQLKAQEELLKVKMASEQPAFQVLEYAEVPDLKSGPSRGMLCIIVTFAAFFFSIFLAFLLNALKNIKNDPEAMKKLRGK